MLLRFIGTIAVASASGLICKRFKIPAGALIGAMFGVLFLNILTEKAYFPMSLRPYFRVLAGVYIGCRVTRKDIRNLDEAIPAAIIMSIGLLVLSLLGGLLISRVTGLDIKTALLSTAPGGVQEMSIIAEDVGADASKVAILQMSRILFVVSFMPFLIGSLSKQTEALYKEQPHRQSKNVEASKRNNVRLIATILAAAAGGLVLDYFEVPAGAMVGSMMVIIVLMMAGNAVSVPGWIKTVTQLATGSILGARLGISDLIGLREIAVPAVMLLIVMTSVNLAAGFMVYRFTKLDMSTALYSCAPGGSNDMAILAEEMGCDTPKVIALHVLRICLVVVVYPMLMKLID